MTSDPLIQASERTCANCDQPGYRWISFDPDIPAFVLCQKHLAEFEIRLFDEIGRTDDH